MIRPNSNADLVTNSERIVPIRLVLIPFSFCAVVDADVMVIAQGCLNALPDFFIQRAYIVTNSR
jgi:hypothetical protein